MTIFMMGWGNKNMGLYVLNSLVQDGRGIFRMAIIEKKGGANSALEKQMIKNKKLFMTILYFKVGLRGSGTWGGLFWISEKGSIKVMEVEREKDREWKK